jgi:hypothetical protein
MRRALLITLAIALALAVPASARVATLGPGSWSWFQDPRAVHVVGQFDQTYVGFIDWSGNVTIAAYDPRFGIVTRQVVGTLFHDDHSAPAILVEPDKRLTVFWSGHNGGEMDFRTSILPENVRYWGPLGRVPSTIPGVTARVSLGFTYPNPVLLTAEGNLVYFFWRGANYSQDYVTRTPDMRWSRSHELISAPGQRPYVKVASNGRDEIAFAYTNGHPRETATSVYYMAYRHGWLYNAAGRRIARMGSGPIAPQRGSPIYDERRTGVHSWVWDVALGAGGTPVVVYATFPRGGNHEYWYARWSGKRWASHPLAFAGGTISPGSIEYEYSAGITLDHSDPSVLFLSRKVHGAYEIEKWTTADGGYRWKHEVVVHGGHGVDNVRPVVPRGWTGGPMGLVWLRGHYGTYTDYRTTVSFFTGR